MKKYYLILIFILALGFSARLYRFNNPIADWHSWRQADTSAVSRNFVNKGFDILHPRFDDLSNVPSGIDNPQGYRFVEFPIYNIFQAGLYKMFDFFTLEEWGRLVTIFSSLSTSVFIFLILKKHQNEIAGLLGAFFFAIMPFNVYFGRTILPDPSAAAAILAGIYFFDFWISENSKFKTSTFAKASADKQNSKFQSKIKNLSLFGLTILFTAAALLLKPFAIFFTIPIIYLVFEKFGINAIKKWQLWIFGFLTIIPLLLWRVWINQFPEGIPFSSWLFNDGNIRFKGAYFYWIFGERIGKLISGYFGVSFLVLGLIAKFKNKKELLFFYSFIVGALLYLVVVARGNVQHDYYQILIMPTVCIFLALGAEFLLNFTKTYTNKYIGPILFVIVSFLSIFLSWYYIRDYFNINNPSIIIAGQAVDRLTPKNAKVIANHNGDTSFLYQTKRQGWASYEHDLPEMVKMGADYMVLVNPSAYDLDKAKNYKVIDKTSQYIIFNLAENP